MTLTPGDRCPGCGETVTADPAFPPPNHGHSPMRMHYRCPCGGEWTDEWCATTESPCPDCDELCEPMVVEDLPGFRSELTPEGEQLVIPGCEKDDERTGAVQLDLF